MGTVKWLPVDVLLVSAFAVIGRLSHDESVRPGEWWHTAWPFLVGLLVGWALVVGLRLRPGSVVAGLVIWPVTVAGGMVLRAMTDQGVAVSFVVVASAVLALMLVGTRVAGRLVSR